MRALRFLPFALTLVSPMALADLPDIPDSAFAEACDAARAVDACPSCKCAMRTSTSPHPAGETSNVPLGVVLELTATLEEGVTYSAIHVAIGGREKLEHVGRLAQGRTGTPYATSYDVVALQQGFQMCPGGCDFEAMGIIHPFEVKTMEDGFDVDEGAALYSERTVLALCFEGPGGTTCAAMPIAAEERRDPVSMAPGHKPKPASKAGFKRTWKLGKAGDVVFGAAKGKLAQRVAEAKGFKVGLMDLANHPDAVQLVRYPEAP